MVRLVHAVRFLWGAAAITLPAQTFTTLHRFDVTDGAYPNTAPVQGTDGNFYGLTNQGGMGVYGTAFRMTPSGAITTLYNFCERCAKGGMPDAGLVMASSGEFYGTTYWGGTADPYAGTVFEMSPDGAFTSLHSFCSLSNCADGYAPSSNLVQAANGDLYGTTLNGGASGQCVFEPQNGCGTIFKVTPSGAFSTAYSFCSQAGCTDGEYPLGSLIQARDGNLYGATWDGGTSNACPPYGGCGTVYRLSPLGGLTTLYSFCTQAACTDGSQPRAGLVEGEDGDLYGTTQWGGAYNGGTVFKITRSGALTVLYSFCAQNNCVDGKWPLTPLTRATDGNFYGTTSGGGLYNQPIGYGTIFKMTPGGMLTSLYSFCAQANCSDGYLPTNMVQATNGALYGGTSGGGIGCPGMGCGTIFSLSLGLRPFVRTQPLAGKVGETIDILGNDLAGATGVTFNGTPARFKVVSSSWIVAWVPAGATSGKVQVVTPGGTVTSNVAFQVVKGEIKDE